MNDKIIIANLVCCLFFVSPILANAPRGFSPHDGKRIKVSEEKNHQEVSVGLRNHVDNSAFEKLPFGNNDLSCGLAYEYHEFGAYWHFALDYAPYISGSKSVDSVLTPQLNLIMEDRCYRAGVGVLKSYMMGDDDNWTDFYWQFILGLHFGMSKNIGVDLDVFYVLENWSELGEFSPSDMECGLSFSMTL